MSHESTVVAVPDKRCWRATCTCGWTSNEYLDHHAAVKAEAVHIETTR